MLFSEFYKIPPSDEDDWFDPLLIMDTPLFVDPFLIYDSDHPDFVGSHDEVIRYFNNLFMLVAEGGIKEESEHAQLARELAKFPEIAEVCLGYSENGTRGRGGSRHCANLIIGAIHTAIRAGLKSVDHFEEIGILQPGFGADRISDITLFILREHFARYTRKVCLELGVELREFTIKDGHFNADAQQWVPLKCELPLNPFENNAVLLVPKRFLRQLPTFNMNDFYEYCLDNESETLRKQFNIDVSKRVSKKQILDAARRNISIVRRYAAQKERFGSRPYDLRRDPKRVRAWYEESRAFVDEYPIDAFLDTKNGFKQFVQELVINFKHFVEQYGGWKLLRGDNGHPRNESLAQKLFMATIFHYCQKCDVDVSPETNIGRGPVDFKLSKGSQRKVLIELKLIRSSRFWHGFEVQLPVYLFAEQCECGFYVGIGFNPADMKRSGELAAMVKAFKGKHNSEYIGIDAQRPESASRAGAA